MTLQIYKIASVTVGSAGATSFNFTNIPQGYRDLKIVFSGRNNYPGDNLVFLSINGSTASLTTRWLNGNGSTAVSGNATSGTFAPLIGRTSDAGDTANTFGNSEIYIPNYANTSINKSISSDTVQENNGTAAFISLHASLWSSTSAITSVAVGAQDGWLQYSTATLYGIL